MLVIGGGGRGVDVAGGCVGEACAGDDAGDGGVGVGGDGGGGGEAHSTVMFNVVSLSAFLSNSGVELLLGLEVDCCAAVVPLLFARTAALLLAREAISTALAFFVGRGLVLSTCICGPGVVDDNCVSSTGAPEESEASGGGDEGAVAVIMAMPVDGVSEIGRFPSASLFLSSRRLLFLACSRLLLPECCAWARTFAAESQPVAVAVDRNQRHTSSISPSVSNTSLAGMPSLLQRTHAMYWLCAQGRGRVGEPVLVLVGRTGVLMPSAGGCACV